MLSRCVISPANLKRFIFSNCSYFQTTNSPVKMEMESSCLRKKLGKWVIGEQNKGGRAGRRRGLCA